MSADGITRRSECAPVPKEGAAEAIASLAPKKRGKKDALEANERPLKKAKGSIVHELSHFINTTSYMESMASVKTMANVASPTVATVQNTVIEVMDGDEDEVIEETAEEERTTVRQYLDKKDAASTGNMHKHATRCWNEAVKLAMETGSVKDAREVLANCKDGSIAAAFQVKGKGKLTYSHRQHTRAEIRYEYIPFAYSY
ncbi:hypothetical protein BDQ17DRAFT_1338564 [Cyathus striatus]|nr:hypothetical protein BDQ17DRAFT_1338564 [Cyathus striatus]